MLVFPLVGMDGTLGGEQQGNMHEGMTIGGRGHDIATNTVNGVALLRSIFQASNPTGNIRRAIKCILIIQPCDSTLGGKLEFSIYSS
jgi:hypothetical protein